MKWNVKWTDESKHSWMPFISRLSWAIALVILILRSFLAYLEAEIFWIKVGRQTFKGVITFDFWAKSFIISASRYARKVQNIISESWDPCLHDGMVVWLLLSLPELWKMKDSQETRIFNVFSCQKSLNVFCYLRSFESHKNLGTSMSW